MLRISHLSVEYIKVPILKGPPELTDLLVEMAILPDGQDPDTGDWETAVWLGQSAAALIGPGTDFPLVKGVTYGIWVRITSGPEAPLLGPYPLNIT
ncbi:hypothetical protein AB0K40_17840 [Nonomuraea bangladeshensis]|uniref:Uncharacterized protein n=1 Tax=Nonomuraea bangladeshensis TaxID=404385 RepID=A0ABV3H4B3_9ACTN